MTQYPTDPSAVAEAPPKKFCFRVEAGEHEECDPSVGVGANGNVLTRKYRTGDLVHTDTDLDAKFNPRDPSFPKKFSRVHEGEAGNVRQDGPITVEELVRRGAAPELVARLQAQQAANPVQAQPAPAPQVQPAAPPRRFTDVVLYTAWLEKLTPKQLQEHAAEEEVDLKGAASKDAMIKTLRAAFKV